jgi:hypothetical protein
MEIIIVCMAGVAEGQDGRKDLDTEAYPQLHVLKMTPHLKELMTSIRDREQTR